MKSKQIASMTKEQITAKIEELAREKIKLSAQISSGTLKNPSQIKNTRRTVARLIHALSKKKEV